MPETLVHFLPLLSLSLLRRSLLSLPHLFSAQQRPRASEARATTASERAVERPWHRRRPPRRRACSPTGEHATVERPGYGAPLAELFFSRAGEGPFRRTARFVPSPFPFFPVPFSLLGLTRGGVGVKIRVRVSLFHSIRPIQLSLLLISFLFRSSEIEI